MKKIFDIDWEGVLPLYRTNKYIVIIYRDCETELLMVEKRKLKNNG